VEALEFLSLSFVVALTDNPSGIREAVARNVGLTPEQVADSPLYLTGSGAEIQDRLHKRREQAGLNYIVIQGQNPAAVERFAREVVQPLTR
jgi:hypothetical protein